MFCLLGSFYLKILQSFSNSTVQIAMIKFRSKFQFQIPLQFYWAVEKVEACDADGTSTTIFSTFIFWLLFRFFMIVIQTY